MLKINPVIPKGLKRYCAKNTINGKYTRNIDLATVSGLCLGVQIVRFPYWGIPDIGMSAVFVTTLLRGLSNALNHRIDLSPIKKRAKAIKKATKA